MARFSLPRTFVRATYAAGIRVVKVGRRPSALHSPHFAMQPAQGVRLAPPARPAPIVPFRDEIGHDLDTFVPFLDNRLGVWRLRGGWHGVCG